MHNLIKQSKQKKNNQYQKTFLYHRSKHNINQTTTTTNGAWAFFMKLKNVRQHKKMQI